MDFAVSQMDRGCREGDLNNALKNMKIHFTTKTDRELRAGHGFTFIG